MLLDLPRPRRRARALPTPLPVHVGLVMDGNRRWARHAGYTSPTVGHRVGAEHLQDFLGWCADAGIEHVTVYVLSRANIVKRSSDEMDGLFGLLRATLPDVVRRSPGWRLHVSGDLSLVPDTSRTALEQAARDTADRPHHLTLAIGYDGHEDIVSGIRSALAARSSRGESFDGLTPEEITDALPGGPVKDIDLVIRTSGERRLSGFFPWQASSAELFLSPKMWPAFSRRDFEAALRFFAERRTAPRD